MQNQIHSGRIEIIDVIRGFTLLGIALIHFEEQFYLGPLPEALANGQNQNVADIIVLVILTTFVQGKFYMIFSFLFGLSFFIQLDKSDRSSKFVWRFSWRLVVLFIIGIIHQLHFAGDILMKYAVLGFVLLLMHRLSNSVLLALSILLVINIPSFVLRLYHGITMQPPGIFGEEGPTHDYFHTMKTGDYLSFIKANWAHMIPKLKFQLSSGRIFITTGLFFLGLLAGRHRYFEHWMDKAPVMKRLIRKSLWGILGCIVLALVIFGSVFFFKVEVRQPILMAIGRLLIDVSNLCMVIIIIAGICLLYRNETWKKRLQVFSAPGRMGLTTYVTQALFGMLIYSGVGLALLGELGTAVNALIGVIVFVIQTYFSKWWLSKFNYGPFEWLWRSATNFNR